MAPAMRDGTGTSSIVRDRVPARFMGPWQSARGLGAVDEALMLKGP
jgi:hypothetical protein